MLDVQKIDYRVWIDPESVLRKIARRQYRNGDARGSSGTTAIGNHNIVLPGSGRNKSLARFIADFLARTRKPLVGRPGLCRGQNATVFSDTGIWNRACGNRYAR